MQKLHIRLNKEMISNNLISVRTKKNLDISVVSKDLGISKERIREFESCKKIPSLKEFIKLANYYSTSLDELVIYFFN